MQTRFPRVARPGTVIHGTLRNVDLIPAFLAELSRCDPKAWEQLQMQTHPLPPAHALEDPDSKWWRSEASDEFVAELIDALDACAPPGHYFGAHWGDGSDFGFWPSEEYEGNARGIYADEAVSEDDFVVQRDHRGRYVVDHVGRGGTHTTIGSTRGFAVLAEALQAAREHAHVRGISAAVIWGLGEDGKLRQLAHAPRSHQTYDDPSSLIPNARRYWTVVIPYSERPTKWHPTERSGPLSVLTRGAFGTEQEAHAWAKKHLQGQSYRVEERPDHAGQAGKLRASDVRGMQIQMDWQGQSLLGDVQSVYDTPSGQRLRVRHFNGQPWPVEPLVYEVTVLERTYDENAPPPPPRRDKIDTQRRLARTVSDHERRERPFDPAAPRERYAKPHHFAVNVRGGGKRSAAWSPEEELWRRRELILPNEPDPDSSLKDSVLNALYQWHGGQSSAVYSLASTGHSDLVSRSMIAAALRELEPELSSVHSEDKAHLQALLGELEMILSYPEGASAEEAGMEIEEYEYDTWSDYEPNAAHRGSPPPGRLDRDMIQSALALVHQWENTMPREQAARDAARSMNLSAQEEAVLRRSVHLAPNSSRGERARAALAGEPEPGVDEDAARELELYIDSDIRFSPASPEGHMGASIRKNLLRKIKKGTYNHDLAAQGWMPAVEAAAKAYVKEFGEARQWHAMFNAPTRRAVARSIADSFKQQVDNGEWA